MQQTHHAVELFNKLSLPLISCDITLVSKQCIINIWICNTEEWNTALHLHTHIHQNCDPLTSHPKNSQRKAVVIIRIWRWTEKGQTHEPALYPLQTIGGSVKRTACVYSDGTSLRASQPCLLSYFVRWKPEKRAFVSLIVICYQLPSHKRAVNTWVLITANLHWIGISSIPSVDWYCLTSKEKKSNYCSAWSNSMEKKYAKIATSDIRFINQTIFRG